MASEVIARSQDPVIIVGPRIDDFAPGVEEGVSASGVVACIDENPVSASVLPLALRRARLLVTVAEPVPSYQPVTRARRSLARRRLTGAGVANHLA